MTCVSPRRCVKVVILITSECDLTEEKVFIEVTSSNEVLRVGPNPGYKEDILAQRETCAERRLCEDTEGEDDHEVE